MKIIKVILIIILIFILIFCLGKFYLERPLSALKLFSGYDTNSKFGNVFSNIGYEESVLKSNPQAISQKLNLYKNVNQKFVFFKDKIINYIGKTIECPEVEGYKDIMIISDIHGNTDMKKIIMENISKNNNLKIIFLGDLFHRYNILKDVNTAELCDYFIELMNKGQLLWFMGNHDFIQFYISNLILTHNMSKDKNLNSKLLSLITQKDRKSKIKILIQSSINITLEHPNVMKKFVDSVKSKKILYFANIGKICFSHSAIFNNLSNVDLDNIIEHIDKQGNNLNDKTNNFINPFDMETLLWPNGNNERIIYSNSRQSYIKDKLSFEENFIGHSNAYSTRLGLPNTINDTQEKLKQAHNLDSGVNLLEQLRKTMLRGIDFTYDKESRIIHYCDMCCDFSIGDKFYSKPAYVMLNYNKNAYDITYVSQKEITVLTDTYKKIEIPNFSAYNYRYGF